MNCPEPVARILLELLYRAALNVRLAGWAGDAHRCALEADHVHNLPHLIADYSDDRLRYYWQAERGSYLRSCELMERPAPPEYLRLWEELSHHLA